MDIIVRNYKPADKIRLLTLIKIYNQYFSDIDPWKVLKYPKNAPKYYLEQTIQGSAEDGKFFVAEINGIIVGFIHGQIHKQSKAEIMERGKRISGDIKDFFVLEEFRSKGIGTALIKKMEKYFQENHCTSIALDVFAPNITARDFYQKWGFTERAIVLVKRLPSI